MGLCLSLCDHKHLQVCIKLKAATGGMGNGPSRNLQICGLAHRQHRGVQPRGAGPGREREFGCIQGTSTYPQCTCQCLERQPWLMRRRPGAQPSSEPGAGLPPNRKPPGAANATCTRQGVPSGDLRLETSVSLVFVVGLWSSSFRLACPTGTHSLLGHGYWSAYAMLKSWS